MSQPSSYKIFITYRRDDSQDTVGRIYDRLKDRFGRDSIFKDVDSIPAGYSFPGYINHVLGQCRVVLVVMGQIWATVTEKDGAYAGQPRLNNPEDRVRVEVERALALSSVNAAGEPTSGLLLIPLLVQDAHMPGREQLPESLRPLTERNSRQIRRDPDFEQDTQRLMNVMAQWMGDSDSPTAAPSPVAVPTASGDLPPLGPAPAPTNSVPAYHLTPMSLYNLGYRGYSVSGVECILPPICPVPAGVFAMGSDKNYDFQAYDREIPQYPVEVGDFAIGQYPVVVAEYMCAIRARAMITPLTSDPEMDWARQLLRLDHPVVYISWKDALNYTSWLAQLTQQPWRLPSEAEWEKAARGTDGRVYPWGSSFDSTLCNTAESGVATTTAVGSYSQGSSPYHSHDMSGNAWEWTSSVFMRYPYRHNDGREILNTAGQKVLRGGSWKSDSRSARAAGRIGNEPAFVASDFGFRLAWRADDPSDAVSLSDS